MMVIELPRISIVTPSLNQANYIETTIHSVLDQGYPKLEYLIVDGGSTDGTIEILKKYDKHLTWSSEKDRGQSDAINKGFRRTSGDILAYINSDDCYEPDAFQKVGEYFAKKPDAHWVTGKCRIIDEKGNERRRLITQYKNLWLFLKSYKVLLVLDYISQPATFWRRTVIEKIGLFDENEHLSMDYDYSLRAGQHFSLHVIDSYLAAFRIHPSSKSRLIREHFNSDLAIAKRYTNSHTLQRLHQLHNLLIITTYEHMLSTSRPK
jgi:glycosyltransferase involved in cell wall biosynthesis